MIAPTTFAVHLTYTCPLACAHCCFSSSPQVKDRLDPDLVLETIEGLGEHGIELAAFTGGEPFLLGRHLPRFIRAAKEQGLRTRVVTSGYFGRTPKAAARRLGEVVDAGLDELSISWDDFHEEFVDFRTVRNVAAAARQFDLLVAVNVVQTAESRWTAARVRKELGVQVDDVVMESPVNLTGRAERELADEPLREDRALGPCPYVLTGPTLSAKGKLLACCGVIPDTERLVIDPEFRPDKLDADLAEARSSVLFSWLYLRGPYAILQWLNENYGVEIPPPELVGGNCQACKHLFEDPAIEEILDDALLAKGPEVVGEYRLLESLGAADPLSVVGLWSGRITMQTRPSERWDQAREPKPASSP